MEQMPEILNDAPPWLKFVLVIVVACSFIVTMLQKPVGAVSGWWRERQAKAVEADKTTLERRVSELQAEIKRVDAARVSDRYELQQELQVVKHNERLQHRYIVWVTRFIRDLEVWAAKIGVALPPPPFLTYTEWRREHEHDEED